MDTPQRSIIAIDAHQTVSWFRVTLPSALRSLRCIAHTGFANSLSETAPV